MTADICLGIMSGTSLDGIDVAACRFSGKQIELVGFHSAEWPPALRDELLEFATTERVNMNDLVRSHFRLAKEYASAVEATLLISNITPSMVRAIGLHGQTVRHLPSGPIPATFQLGSGAALAAMTEIDVVSDFRAADIALGGQGAPLMPMFDHYFLVSDSVDRLIVNIGGIANVTWLPAQSMPGDVIAFDSGPGNMLLDATTRRYFGKPFDENGDTARSGKIDSDLLEEFLSHPYFTVPPPKSTGRELFSESFLEDLNQKIANGKLAPEDALATLTELTARSILKSFDFFPSSSSRIEIIVSGGGAFNKFLLDRLRSNAPESAGILTSDDVGIPAKTKEAIAFAFFARAFVESITIHLPSTTGASHRTVLGSLSKGK
jgi:anhydro-N-acetylmuramic acid kinase